MKLGAKFGLTIAAVIFAGLGFEVGVYSVAYSFVVVASLLLCASLLHYLDRGLD